jgi:ubiquinone/menaquinone biosynthesis C-methylase UbiE
MERLEWLRERRAAVEQDYTRDAPTYDAGYDPTTPTHRRFVSRLADLTPAAGAILDAACGTAPYAGVVLDRGLGYVGVDQSAGMLAQAAGKWPVARFELIGLQELAFDDGFDGLMCTDAMENVPPEHWPTVVGNFRRALHPGAHAYLTVEEIDHDEIAQALEDGASRGWPIVLGEVIEGDTAGYHFYPGRTQVERWLHDAGFDIIEEADEDFDDYAYHHLLLRTRAG